MGATNVGLKRTTATRPMTPSSGPESLFSDTCLTVLSGLEELWTAITNSMGTLQLKSGHFEEAQKLFVDAIARRESMGIFDRETIYMKRNVGIALLSANRVQDALTAYKDSLALLEAHIAASSIASSCRSECSLHRLSEQQER